MRKIKIIQLHTAIFFEALENLSSQGEDVGALGA